MKTKHVPKNECCKTHYDELMCTTDRFLAAENECANLRAELKRAHHTIYRLRKVIIEINSINRKDIS